MDIKQAMLDRLDARRVDELVLELNKALYVLNQAGRLWSELLHKKLANLGSMQCLTDMGMY